MESNRDLSVDADVLRILDVNSNRAREALRVIEDYARFALDDADAAAAAKRHRHDLQQASAALGHDALRDARDIASDVGRQVKTPGELHRADLDEIVRAAFGRLTEAARGLGEYGKLVGGPLAVAAETLRYGAYELEQRIVLRGSRRAQFRRVRLYVLITQRLCRHDWLATAEAVLRAGAGCLQLRENELADAELLRRARQLRALTRQHHGLLAINNRPDIAKLAGADIVHVGQDDLPVREARRIAGASLLVGKSTHSLAQLDAALAECPDYLALGPMFPSRTKPQERIAGPQLLTEAARRTQLPLVAIGGITPQNSADIIPCGASCLAVCAAVIGAEDPAAAAAAILNRVPS